MPVQCTDDEAPHAVYTVKDLLNRIGETNRFDEADNIVRKNSVYHARMYI